MTDGARVSLVSAGSCAASCLNWVRRALLLLWQGINCRPAGARRRPATCFRVPPRSMYHARPRCAAGGAAGHGDGAAVWVQCFWCAVFSRRERFGARRPSHTRSFDIFASLALSSVVRAVGSKAHVVCSASSSCPHTDRRLHLGHARLALACRRCSQHNHHALLGAAARARAFASRWVSRGTGAHEEAQSSTSPRLTLPHRRRVSAVLTRRSAHPGAGRCSQPVPV
jgi:hypothetical protein